LWKALSLSSQRQPAKQLKPHVVPKVAGIPGRGINGSTIWSIQNFTKCGSVGICEWIEGIDSPKYDFRFDPGSVILWGEIAIKEGWDKKPIQ
jgi:hypothetical protein